MEYACSVILPPGRPAEREPDESTLPTFVVNARFAETAATEEQAAAALRQRLTGASGLFDVVRVERREDDGTWLLAARFVVVSVDAPTAVTGVSATLAEAGARADEVWIASEDRPATSSGVDDDLWAAPDDQLL